MVAGRVAVIGGGRAVARVLAQLVGVRPRHYRSRRDGGRGEAIRLGESLRAGAVRGVVIVARFNGHSTVRGIRAVCSRLGIPVETVERIADVASAVERVGGG